MKPTLVRLLCLFWAIVCLGIPSCAFYGHQAITAPCTHVIQPAKAPADAEPQDSPAHYIYQDGKGDFYAEIWVCEAAMSHDRFYFDYYLDPKDFAWQGVSTPQLAWVKLEKTSEKKYRIVGISNKPDAVRKIRVDGDVSWHISRSEPFETPCGSWRRPLSYVCLALVDVPVSVAVDAVVIPCACIVYAVAWTPIAAPFRWLGHQCIKI